MAKLSVEESVDSRYPGLSIYRPVLNITDRHVGVLRSAITVAGLSAKQVRILLSPSSKALIVSAGEIHTFQEALGVGSTEEGNDELADYLEEVLPESVDEVLVVPTKPIKDYIRAGKKKSAIFTIATENPIIQSERIATQSAISSFYGVDTALNPELKDAWLTYDYQSDVHVARVLNLTENFEVKDVLRALLDRELKLLPTEVELGPASIDEV